jgi:hypothetical protein
MRHNESRLQSACVRWFRLQYPLLSKLLIAVPNGGARNKVEAAILKGEGVQSGAADLLLLIPKGECGCLGVEMKIGKGRQTENQKVWQEDFEGAGNRYVVCRNFEEFRETIEKYLTNQGGKENQAV